jgi:hypothetical protein
MFYVSCFVHSASRCSTILKGRNSTMTSHGVPNSGQILLFSRPLNSCLFSDTVTDILLLFSNKMIEFLL